MLNGLMVSVLNYCLGNAGVGGKPIRCLGAGTIVEITIGPACAGADRFHVLWG